LKCNPKKGHSGPGGGVRVGVNFWELILLVCGKEGTNSRKKMDLAWCGPTWQENLLGTGKFKLQGGKVERGLEYQQGKEGFKKSGKFGLRGEGGRKTPGGKKIA